MIHIEGLKEVNRVLKKLDSDLAPIFLKDVTQDAFENVIERAIEHHQTGTMEDNIYQKVSKLTGTIGIDDNGMMVDTKHGAMNYTLFVLYGTKKHDIVPKNKKSLRFSSVGAFVYSTRVKHPGYHGDNFLKYGVEDTFKNIDNIFNKVMSYEIK